MSSSKTKTQPEADKTSKRIGLFRPVNDKCRDCNKEVKKNERQELVTDKEGNCRRLCGACIKKWEE